MSLFVRLGKFKVLPGGTEKFITVEFRGITKYTGTLKEENELIDVDEIFKWPVTHALKAGEILTVELISRSRWKGNQLIGVYRLGMHLIVSDGYLSLIDTLVDNNNKSVAVVIEMEVTYLDSEDDGFPPVTRIPRHRSYDESEFPSVHYSGECYGARRNSRPSSSQQSLGSMQMPSTSQASAQHEDDMRIHMADDSSYPAKTPKRRPQNTDLETGDEISRARKLKLAGKRLFKRSFSIGADKAVKSEEREHNPSFLSMRNLMCMGRGRAHNVRADEGQALLDMPGPSSAPDYAYPSRSSMASKEMVIDTSVDAEEPRRLRTYEPLESGAASMLKPSDFQVCVTVIEARQLVGLNVDRVVCVQVGDIRKYTSVKTSTNCPFYDEYFVFDFRMPPVMLFDKIITLSVMQSRKFLRSNKLLGSFKLDLATVWNQPGRQFYHKWTMLTDPYDANSGAKGFLKCDISIVGKGDADKVKPKSENDDDDIEGNLLLPDDVPNERQRAKFIVKIYRADGLPKMNYSIMANVKRALTGETLDLVDPYVQVCFAGMTGCTSVKKNSYAPVWNEQIVFSEMFPPLCQRIKIQLRDKDPVQPVVIGTHFIDLRTISNDGDKGFLPTFGPSFVYMYGSTRNYSFIDQHASLNNGVGEGVSYRARILISVHTEITDSMECPASDVAVEPIPPIIENSFAKNEEFFLFASVFDADMIDKRLADKLLYFELSIGNAGNTLDGLNDSVKRCVDLDFENLDEVGPEKGYWRSTTPPTKAISNDKTYYYLPFWNNKPCMHVRSIWPDHRRRMYNSNLIADIIDNFEESLLDAQLSHESDMGIDLSAMAALKSAIDYASTCCANYVKHMTAGPSIGHTKLDSERLKMCLNEIGELACMLRSLGAVITKNSINDRLRTAFSYLNKLKQLCEDPQIAMPDVFLWLVGNGKRLAYHRVSAREIIYSDLMGESGRQCGKMQTLIMKWPDKKAQDPNGWPIPAKISVYLWLGALQHKKHYVNGLPDGYELNTELRNADKLGFNAPSNIFYHEKHNFQLRAYIYQARSLIGSDSSGLSDPFARIILGENSTSTQVIDETLSPTGDELLVFDDILLYSTIKQIKSDPPTIAIEIFDQDKVGKSEFIGRTFACHTIIAYEDSFSKARYLPTLQWYEITRGDDRAGQLLATFELLEMSQKPDPSFLPELPSPREANGKPPVNKKKRCNFTCP